MPPPILLYDGVCGLCNRLVRLVLRRDHNSIFRFASLQSTFAARILARHGAGPRDLDSVYVVVNYELRNERLLPRSDAVLFLLKRVGGIWTLLGHFLCTLPGPIRDRGYRVVARHRYRIFGRSDTCVLPNPDARDRFLDG